MHALESMCKRMHMRKKKAKMPHPRPLPRPRPPPGPDVNGFVIGVQMDVSNVEDAVFMRFKIPYKEIKPLMASSKLSGSDSGSGSGSGSGSAGPIYVPHQHDTRFSPEHSHRFSQYFFDPDFNGPFHSSCFSSFPCCAIGSVFYCFTGKCRHPRDPHGPSCHAIQSFDFAQLAWNTYDIFDSHRLCQTLVAVDDKIYIFEISDQKPDPSKRGPLGVVFDTSNGSWMDLPYPEVGGEDIFQLTIAPLRHKLLCIDMGVGKQYLLCTETLSWTPLDVDVDLVGHMSRMEGGPFAHVSETNTIYWVDKCANIRAFNVDDLRISVGPIIGFGHDGITLRRYELSLVHLKEEFFCLIWSHGNRRSTVPQSKLHLTLLSISHHAHSPCPHNLAAYVVGCWCYDLDFDASVTVAYLLCKDEDVADETYGEPGVSLCEVEEEATTPKDV